LSPKEMSAKEINATFFIVRMIAYRPLRLWPESPSGNSYTKRRIFRQRRHFGKDENIEVA
ncbi:MAG: hypothetical protein K2X47_19455, partial [Bdellovibrionales bacterium]|nr:hypothetical protein [Bdellovibrionales bacterium]